MSMACVTPVDGAVYKPGLMSPLHEHHSEAGLEECRRFGRGVHGPPSAFTPSSDLANRAFSPVAAALHLSLPATVTGRRHGLVRHCCARCPARQTPPVTDWFNKALFGVHPCRALWAKNWPACIAAHTPCLRSGFAIGHDDLRAGGRTF